MYLSSSGQPEQPPVHDVRGPSLLRLRPRWLQHPPQGLAPVPRRKSPPLGHVVLRRAPSGRVRNLGRQLLVLPTLVRLPPALRPLTAIRVQLMAPFALRVAVLLGSQTRQPLVAVLLEPVRYPLVMTQALLRLRLPQVLQHDEFVPPVVPLQQCLVHLWTHWFLLRLLLDLRVRGHIR